MLDKWRISQGWRPLEDQEEQDAWVATFLEAFESVRVPYDAYDDLYLMAIHHRGAVLATGKDIQFNPELFISLWPALRDKRERDAVDGGRQLPEVAMSVCPKCLGSGWESQKRDGVDYSRRCPNGCVVPA